MSSDLEEAFVRYVTTKGILSRAEIQAAQALQAELAERGLALNAGEVLVGQGLVSEEAYRAAWRSGTGSPAPPLPVPSTAGPDLDQIAVDRGRRGGRLTQADVDEQRAIQAWASTRGMRLGLAELLVRRGFVTSEEILAPVSEEAPGPETPSSRRKKTERAARTTGRTRTRRRPGSTMTTGRLHREKGPRSKAVVAAIALGIAVPLVVAAIALFSGADQESVAPTPKPPGGGPGTKPPIDPPPADAPSDRDDEVEALADRVRALLRDHRFAGAREAIETVRERMPDEATRAKYDPALAKLARSIGPEEERARSPLVGRDDNALWQEAVKATNENRHRDALRIVDDLLKRHPDHLKLLVSRVELLSMVGDFTEARNGADRALQCAERANAQAPAIAAILNLRAQAAEGVFEFDAAKQDLQRSMEIEPQSGFPVYLLARVHRMAGEPAAGLALAPEIVKRQMPPEALFLANLEYGLDRADQGDRDGALSQFAQLESLFTTPIEQRTIGACKAWTWIHPNRPDVDPAAARRILDAQAPLEDGRNYGYYVLVHAAMLHLEGRSNRAMGVLERVNGRWESIPETGYYLAAAARAAGQEERSRRMLDDLARLRPGLASRARAEIDGR